MSDNKKWEPGKMLHEYAKTRRADILDWDRAAQPVKERYALEESKILRAFIEELNRRTSLIQKAQSDWSWAGCMDEAIQEILLEYPR